MCHVLFRTVITKNRTVVEMLVLGTRVENCVFQLLWISLLAVMPAVS